jgi:hypothetical protein
MRHILTIIAVAWLAGCSLPNETIDISAPPVLSFASSSLTVIDVGRLGTVVDTAIVVTATPKGTNIGTVTALIVATDGSSAAYLLADNGVAPDQVKGDGIFTGNVMVRLSASAVGSYAIQVQASDAAGLVSNMIALPVSIISSNNRPPVISQLIAPDTVFVPTGDTPNHIKVSVAVADSDGLASIASVSFTSYRADGKTAGIFQLLDDGGTTTDPSSGDDVAGDGRYTLTLSIPSTTTHNTYYDFVFTAKDKSGAISNSLTKRIYIQ